MNEEVSNKLELIKQTLSETSDACGGLRLRAFSHLEQPIPHSLQQYKRVLLSTELAVSINSSLPCFEVSDAA